MSELKPTNMVLRFGSLPYKNQSVKQKACSHNCVSYSGRLSRMDSCLLFFSLGVLLIFLPSCSTPTHNPSATPSSIADENNTTGTSQPPLTPTPSVKSIQAAPHIRPARPFPDFPPNYLQFLSQELLNAFDNGDFVVGEDGIAANYQAWHEFIGKVNKNKDAVLTIQTFNIDLSKEVNDSTRYQIVGRYHLSAVGNQSVWKYLSDDKDDVSGKLSFMYDAEIGRHKVFIGEKKVFEFIYFPPDPEQIILYFGYTLLEQLPSAYTSEDAIKDGCLVIEQGVIKNIDVLTNYRDSLGNYNDVGYFIRIFYEDNGGITIMDIGAYNERVYIIADYSRCSNRDDMEDMYVTTHYDNSVVGVEISHDVYSLHLSSDFRETIFIFEDVPAKKD